MLSLKARSVLHGNKDRALFKMRRDFASVGLSAIRLVLSLGTILEFPFGTADVTGTYMQSRPIKFDIYARPLEEYRSEIHYQYGKMEKSL